MQAHYQNQTGNICPEILSPRHISDLKFSDGTTAFYMRFAEEVQAEDYVVLAKKNNQYYPLLSAQQNLLTVQVPDDEDYLLIQKSACGGEQTLAPLHSHPYDAQVPIEVSPEMMNALEGWPSDQKIMDFVLVDNGADKLEKLSFIQKQSYQQLPITAGYDVLRFLYEAAANKTEDWIEKDGIWYWIDRRRIAEPCNCGMAVMSNKLHSTMGNINFLWNANSAENYSGKVVEDNFIDLPGPSEQSQWIHTLGGGVDVLLGQHGWTTLKDWNGAEPSYNIRSNIPNVEWPIKDSNQAVPSPTDYQMIKYRLHCTNTNNELPEECGCEKKINISAVMGHRSELRVNLGNGGSGKEGRGRAAVAQVAYSMEENNPHPVLIGAGTDLMEAECSRNFDTTWTDHLGGVLSSVAEMVSSASSGNWKDVLSSSSDFFDDVVSAFTTPAYVAPCGYNSTARYRNLVLASERSYKLQPNRTLNFYEVTFYKAELFGRKRFNNMVKIQTHAGLITHMFPNSASVVVGSKTIVDRNGLQSSVPIWSDPYNCCSKRYANWANSAPGDQVHWNMGDIQVWEKAELGLYFWDQIFMSDMGLGNYGRAEGPAPTDCIKPIPIPPNIVLRPKDPRVIVKHLEQELLILPMQQQLKYLLANSLGQVISSGQAEGPTERINIAPYAGQILILYMQYADQSKTQKIYLP